MPLFEKLIAGKQAGVDISLRRQEADVRTIMETANLDPLGATEAWNSGYLAEKYGQMDFVGKGKNFKYFRAATTDNVYAMSSDGEFSLIQRGTADPSKKKGFYRGLTPTMRTRVAGDEDVDLTDDKSVRAKVSALDYQDRDEEANQEAKALYDDFMGLPPEEQAEDIASDPELSTALDRAFHAFVTRDPEGFQVEASGLQATDVLYAISAVGLGPALSRFFQQRGFKQEQAAQLEDMFIETVKAVFLRQTRGRRGISEKDVKMAEGRERFGMRFGEEGETAIAEKGRFKLPAPGGRKSAFKLTPEIATLEEEMWK